MAVPFTARSTVVTMFPLSEVAQLDPPDATHFHDEFVSSLGNVSVTAAPNTLDGPALVTVTV